MLNIEEVQWNDVRDSLAATSPDIVEAVDCFGPTEKHKLYIATYSYGNEIINKNGHFHLPTDSGQVVPLRQFRGSHELFDQLSYNFNSNPVGIALDKPLELYIHSDCKVIPFGAIPPGKIFGLWKILDEDSTSHCPPVFSWGMTAGSRSLFMLPKISDVVSHRRLMKKYELDIDKPKHLTEHFNIFKELSDSIGYEKRWKARVLFFGKEWFINKERASWGNWHYFLLRKAWKSTEFWRNQFIWDLTFSRIRARKNLKPSAYISAIVRHILAVAVGALPGYTPAIDDSFAPVEFLKKIYIEDYQLKTNYPILMQPSYLAEDNDVYLSLQHFSAVEDFLRNNIRLSALDIAYQVSWLLEKNIEEIKSGALNIETTPLHSVPEDIQFKFYHGDHVDISTIYNTEILPEEDHRFKNDIQQNSNLVFPKRCSFLQGCIKISKIKT